jgi:heparanase
MLSFGTHCPRRARRLLSFTEMARARMIFGLSMNTGKDVNEGGFPYPWDATNARAILSWTIEHGLDHLLVGLELGNEQNTKYSAEKIAHSFAALHNLTLELWPDGARRPRLFGPDPHSLHDATGSQLEWIADFLRHCDALGVPVEGATHHEYIEVDPTAAGFTSPTRLALNAAIAAAVNHTVRSVSRTVGIWGGEIGPHNGGSPPCDHSSMRWAVFGDSFWYADALAAKARHGYAGFCRQDYIGADYGLVDCSTGAPLPDFFTALMWTHVMGPTVLSARLTDESGSVVGDGAVVRAAAHCLAAGESAAPSSGGVGLMLINLSNRSTTARFDPDLGGVSRVYVLEPSPDPTASLTGEAGLLGTGVTLNGVLLRAAADGTVARPVAAAGHGGNASLPAHSIAFFALSQANHPDCRQ